MKKVLVRIMIELDLTNLSEDGIKKLRELEELDRLEFEKGGK